MNARFLNAALLLGFAISTAHVALAQPSVVPGGVLNAASFAKNANGQGTPVSPGSLVSIFGTGLGTSQADADSVPFSTSLGGVSVTFNGVAAPLRDVIPAASLVNAQIPFEVLAAGLTSGTVNVVVTVGTVKTAPQAVSIVPQAPGLFTIPPGVGNAILVNLSAGPGQGTVAGPANANLGLPTSPIPRGSFAFFYATGLGPMVPAVPDGDGGSDGLVHNAVLPQGTSGGIQAQVLFAGQAPGFPGVYQVNIQVPQNAPTGNGVPMQIISVDGTQVSPAGVATISVQ
jgi:uncharacterized protein (TIGR03437 family)